LPGYFSGSSVPVNEEQGRGVGRNEKKVKTKNSKRYHPLPFSYGGTPYRCDADGIYGKYLFKAKWSLI